MSTTGVNLTTGHDQKLWRLGLKHFQYIGISDFFSSPFRLIEFCTLLGDGLQRVHVGTEPKFCEKFFFVPILKLWPKVRRHEGGLCRMHNFLFQKLKTSFYSWNTENVGQIWSGSYHIWNTLYWKHSAFQNHFVPCQYFGSQFNSGRSPQIWKNDMILFTNVERFPAMFVWKCKQVIWLCLRTQLHKKRTIHLLAFWILVVPWH